MHDVVCQICFCGKKAVTGEPLSAFLSRLFCESILFHVGKLCEIGVAPCPACSTADLQNRSPSKDRCNTFIFTPLIVNSSLAQGILSAAERGGLRRDPLCAHVPSVEKFLKKLFL